MNEQLTSMTFFFSIAFEGMDVGASVHLHFVGFSILQCNFTNSDDYHISKSPLHQISTVMLLLQQLHRVRLPQFL